MYSRLLIIFVPQLGHGNFGSVLKGEYIKQNGEKIPVAVKKLKSEEMNNPKVTVRTCMLILKEEICITMYLSCDCGSLYFNIPQSEIMHEAEVMMRLDHPNIVRIIGTSYKLSSI